MNYLEICSLLQIAKQDTVGYSDVARAVGVERQHIAKIKNTEVEEEKLRKIEKYFNVTLPRNFVIASNSDTDEGRIYKIQYWEGCKDFENSLVDPEIKDIILDLNFCENKLKCNPENLRIICMPGEEMAGGKYPLRNKDILIIDVSETSTTNSGVFFVSTHGCSRVYVRRIIERMSDDYVFFTTVDNQSWAEHLAKKWTMEQWKEADIQIIGRVIKNMSLKI